MMDDQKSAVPALHAAPWQKRFWPDPDSAGSAAGLSVLPPRSPPDLYKKTHWTQDTEKCLCCSRRDSALYIHFNANIILYWGQDTFD